MPILRSSCRNYVYGLQRWARHRTAIPLRLDPRIIPNSEWQRIDRGLAQRVVAAHLFLQDVYGKQRIFCGSPDSPLLVYSCKHFMREVIGIEVPRGIHTHICGIDLVRDSKTGEYCVLEDNVRTPSGISYVLETAPS